MLSSLIGGNEKKLMDHQLTLADQITNSKDHIKTNTMMRRIQGHI